MKLSYSEQLKHPNWQRKRLEILNRANFACESCGDKETTLHVHHKRYVKGRKAWEYEPSELRALCESCHARGHAIREALDRILAGTVFGNVPVEEFAYAFLTGMLMPFGIIEGSDVAAVLEDEPSFFGLGYMIAALGPKDVLAAVKLKMAEGRLETRDAADGLLDAIVRAEEAA